MPFTAEDRSRVARAIAAAEATTSGEIFCVVSRRVSSYVDVSLGWAGAAALLAPLALVGLGVDARWLPRLDDGWQAAHLSSQSVSAAQAIGAYAVAQAAVFAAVFLLTRIPMVRRWVTPRSVRRARVRRAAVQQFLAQGVHTTDARTGVLLFVALDDHQVELVADQAIHEQVDRDVWADVVAALSRELRAGRPVAGFEAAITLCGRVLAQHFPPGVRDRNELPDHLVLL